MAKNKDPRVIRTRKSLIDALAHLIIEKDVKSITVREIVHDAGVNRSTFYLHFLDKPDIMNKLQEDLLSVLITTLKFPENYSYDKLLKDYLEREKPNEVSVRLLEHIQKNAKLYKRMFNQMEFRDSVIEVLKKEIFQFKGDMWEATFSANGVVGVVIAWLESDMEESVLDLSLWLTKLALFPLGQVE